MLKHTIISISPSNHYFGFVIMDSWEVKAIIPLSLKGIPKEEKIEALRELLNKLIEKYRPELAVIEKLQGKRETQDNRYILAQTVGIVSAFGLPVKFKSVKDAKKSLCSNTPNPTWQKTVEELVAMRNLSSLTAQNFLARFTGRTPDNQLNKSFRIYPLSDAKRYYWNALSALILGLAYFANNNHIKYEYDNITTQEESSETDGNCS